MNAQALSIRYKLSAAFALVSMLIIVLAVIAIAVQLKSAQRAALLEAEHVATTLLHGGLFAAIGDPARLQAYVENLHRVSQRDLFVVDRNLRIIADSSPLEIGTIFTDDAVGSVGNTIKDGRTRTFTETGSSLTGDLRLVVIPIRNRVADSHGPIMGAVALEYTHIYDELMAHVNNLIYLVIGVALAFIAAAAVLGIRIVESIARPLVAMKLAVARIAGGDYGVRAAVTSKDEFGSLATAFNSMAQDLSVSHAKLLEHEHELKTQVAARTSELNGANSLLEFRNTLLSTQLETSPDAILVIDENNKVISYNQQFVALWNIVVQVPVGDSDAPIFRRVMSQVVDRAAFIAGVQYLFDNRGAKTHDEIPLNDGRIIDRICAPMVGRDATYYGLICFFRDITARKQAEAAMLKSEQQLRNEKDVAHATLRDNETITRELHAAQSDLVTTARQAGMAEIANNVLHNVGNVLNSVNVSASLVHTTMRDSKAVGLTKAVQLMNEHAADLGDFLMHDEKGKLLLGYLNKVLAALAAEQKSVVEEIEALTKRIDHIKDIVATQQSYSGSASVVEPVQLRELVETALQLNAGALKRGQVTVVKDFADLPVLPLDKPRLLQILVNLLRNAEQALESVPERAHQLTLRAAIVNEADGRSLHISVKDNGDGIAPENLARIFAHGFTTRKNGHGYGLHSCAVAAKEMGGTLTVHSDGPGKGAAFTLALPIKTKGDHP